MHKALLVTQTEKVKHNVHEFFLAELMTSGYLPCKNTQFDILQTDFDFGDSFLIEFVTSGCRFQLLQKVTHYGMEPPRIVNFGYDWSCNY